MSVTQASSASDNNTRVDTVVSPVERFKDGGNSIMTALRTPTEICQQNRTERNGKMSGRSRAGKVGACRQQRGAQHHTKSHAVVDATVRVQCPVEVGKLAVKGIRDDTDDYCGDRESVRSREHLVTFHVDDLCSGCSEPEFVVLGSRYAWRSDTQN